MRDKIIVVSTGGTFNKIYNPISGELEVDSNSLALKEILKRWLCSFELVNIIGKDSLEMDDRDRETLVREISKLESQKILVIHGTDTIDKSAKAIASKVKNRTVVLTGAMRPFSIDEVEASANLAFGIGFLKGCRESGVFIAMNSLVAPYYKIKKDREKGCFILLD